MPADPRATKNIAKAKKARHVALQDAEQVCLNASQLVETFENPTLYSKVTVHTVQTVMKRIQDRLTAPMQELYLQDYEVTGPPTDGVEEHRGMSLLSQLRHHATKLTLVHNVVTSLADTSQSLQQCRKLADAIAAAKTGKIAVCAPCSLLVVDKALSSCLANKDY